LAVTESNPPQGSERPAAAAPSRKVDDAPAQSSGLQRQRAMPITGDNPAKPGSQKPLNGAGATPAAAASPARRVATTGLSPARTPVSYSRQSEGVGRGVTDPYPPLSERPVNGVGTTSMDAKRSDSTRPAPRSPRTALEPDTVELPPPRSRSVRHPLVVIGNAIISLVVLVGIAAGALLVLGDERFEAPGPLSESRVVIIPHGSGIRDIADVLQHEGVIDQPWVFIGGVLVLKAREGLKAGEYRFQAHASLHDVVDTIVDGKVVEHQISTPEGMTSEQVVAHLMDDDFLAGNIAEIPREGSLLPDTYNFTRGVTREQMIQRMQQAQQRLVKDIWDHRASDLPIKTPDQLVILASLIEKETGKPDERTRVAAVFVNRLKQKMRLQSDPTIIYGLVGGKGTLGRPIMKSEIDQPTPYNTYQIDGLPPGPICNPGRASLEAAANPARTREIYFVADGTGGHVFADTYEQHQKNVARLRSIETGQKDQAPADATLIPPAAQAAPAPSAPTAASRRVTRPNQATAH
jgi:UPF0755 protein